MNDFIKRTKYITDTAEQLQKGNIDFVDISFEEIYKYIIQVYKALGNKDFFTKIYMNLLTKGLEHKDKEEVTAILWMLGHHGAMLIQQKSEITFLNEKVFRAKSNLAYYKNLERIRLWHEKHGVTERIPFSGKGVIYTAITGDYDDVKEPGFIHPDYDYILFTNNPRLKSDIWEVRYVENEEELDNVKLARRIKILGHEYLPEYDFSIWVDANMEIIGDMDDYKNKYRRKELMLCFNHPKNNCIYQEKEDCLALKKDIPEIMELQMERYRQEGYPKNNGVISSGVLVRELHNEKVRKVMETWWKEILNGSRRDQLSFNYACWKNDFVYDTSELSIYGNEYVRLHNHK